ncbi:MAG: NAD(P)-dependent oxidoreductase [Betaproteobacteria bacterium]|nr:NAD(P)-dependent oxidoreductase [Betaproteobacteria bacterium]
MDRTVGFIGLGQMGAAMAATLLKAGYRLRVYNRSPEKSQALLALGAQLAATPHEAAQAGGVVITMVSDDTALELLATGPDGFAQSLGPGGLHLSMSTISPALSRRLAALHRDRAAFYVAAPVLGRPDAAAARKLWIIQAGNAEAKAIARPYLEALSQGIFDFGEDPGGANIVKLAGNVLLASALEAMAETLAFAEKNGIPRTAFAEMLGATLFPCPVYQNYGRAIASELYEPAGFKLALGLKDVTLALAAAAESRVPMRLASVVRDQLLSAAAKGRAGMDWSALGLEASESAGLRSTGAAVDEEA